MNATALIEALGLPAEARVDQRVPKKLLGEHGAPTAGDKRQINEGIEELRWVAALKPTTIGVAEYRDAAREYLEIAVLTLQLRPGAKADRLTELVHRAVPYPVWLVTAQPPKLALSLAHKRWSQGETDKTVLDSEIIEVGLLEAPDESGNQAFLRSLALARQLRTNLYVLYQGWIDCVTALLVSRITGPYVLPQSTEHAAALRDALENHARLQRDIARLRAQAAKEKQISRRVELNLEIKRLELQLDTAKETLSDG